MEELWYCPKCGEANLTGWFDPKDGIFSKDVECDSCHNKASIHIDVSVAVSVYNTGATNV